MKIKTPIFMIRLVYFGSSTVKLVRNGIKNKFSYNGWGIAVDAEGSWSFGNNFARNAVIFAVDNSSSWHTYNKNKLSF